MTLAAQFAKAGKDLAWLLEIEVAKRIDDETWASAGSDAYYITPAEGEPTRIRAVDCASHVVTEYAEKGSLAACQAAAGSWFFDTSTGRLYVRATEAGSGPASASPSSGFYYMAAYYMRRFCDGQREDPYELVFGGVWYDPRLERDALPELSMEVSGFTEGGVRQAWGELRLLNGDGELDQQLVDYIWENKVFVLKVGAPGDDYADYVTVSRGRTGSITWDENRVSIGVRDPLRAED